MKQRLSKVLAAKGVASRRACEDIIFAGRVEVNGQVTLIPQTMVDDEDIVMVDNQQVGKNEKKVYYILNKPLGYYCSPVPKERYKYVLDLFIEVKERVFTVGRLDRDTTGLIIVTNDGHFANKVIHPSSNIQKEYVVKTNSEITADHLKQIAEGIYIEGTLVVPLKVLKVRKGTLKVVVTDGKKREVRLLVTSAGIDVVELTRTRIGGLHLGSLKEGEYRPMKGNEMNAIFE
jgi:23S rRNA pseudouridine2605 synthase